MNFLHKFPKVVFIFFPLVFLLPKTSTGQNVHYELIENSWIQIIHPDDYSGSAEYFEITFDTAGQLYIAARNRILNYDGLKWSSAVVPGKTHLTVSDRGMVYAWGDNSFGTIRHSINGSLVFEDIHADTGSPVIRTGTIRGIFSAGPDVYLLAEGVLYRLSGDRFIQVLAGVDIKNAFEAGGHLYLYAADSGLLRYSGDSLYSIMDQDHLTDKEVVDCFELGSKFFLRLSGDHALYTMDGTGMVAASFFTAAGHRITSTDKFLVLSDSLLIVINNNSDIRLFNEAGVLLQTIKQERGKLPREIRDACYDRYGNLWILHQAAISKMELFPPLREYGPYPGQAFPVNAVAVHRQDIYMATPEGVFFVKDAGLPYRFLPMAAGALFDHRVPSYSLLPFNGSLLIACEEGVYNLQGTHPQLISAIPSRFLSRSTLDSSVVYMLLDEGFAAIRKVGGDWQDLGRSAAGVHAINSIYDSDDGTIWIGTDYSGVFKSEPRPSYDPSVEYTAYHPGNARMYPSAGIKVFRLDGEPVFAGSGGLYHYDPVNDKLSVHPVNRLLDNTPVLVISVHAAPSGISYICFRNPVTNHTGLLQYNTRKSMDRQSGPSYFRRLDPVRINDVSSGPPGLLLATSGGLFELDRDFQAFARPAPVTYIDRCMFGNHTVIRPPGGGSFNADPDPPAGIRRIPHSVNRLCFEFRSSELYPEYRPLFQYRLDGYDKWSEWTGSCTAEYGNPGTGDYSFMVRCMDQYGRISAPALYSFRVKAPLFIAWWTIVLYSFIILFMIFFYRKWRSYQHLQQQYRIEDIISERTEAILKEKEQTEILLANILPKKTADELKKKGKATSSKFKMVTVLFSDIQGFTKIAEQMNPDKLIDELDSFYFHFDTVVEKYNIEKIKTIGDAYMAAGGIPVKNRTNPVEVVMAALEMQHYMNELKKENAEIWDLRIGIHTGSVIAGVVGQKKFSYDIWGDTVNTASRMESSGEAGRVNISGSTHQLVQDFFECEYRGKMPVKYKGDLDMYFVLGLKPGFQDINKFTGNSRFQVQLQLLRLQDLEEFVLQKLEKESPDYLFFHNAAHTYHVYTQVELLGRAENLGEEDLLLLRTAALFHDIGYLEGIEDHELKSVEMARTLLPDYKFDEEQSRKICELILATRIPPEPKNLLEQIMCDANLDHLGRVDFLILSDKLFQEYRTKNLFKSKKEWNNYQIEFLKNHDFFTHAARKLREVSKEEQIENIRQFS